VIVIRHPLDAAEIFRRLRQYNGWSKRQMGRKVGYSPRTIDDRDAGNVDYRLEAFIQTAAVFGYTVALVPAECDHCTGRILPTEGRAAA
jgi:transcriptional regulator with XRE-family HTH domain